MEIYLKNKIYIINGPNLNKLGTREPEKYGALKLQEIESLCKKKSDELNLSCDFFQSNVEGEIVNKIHDAIDKNIIAIIVFIRILKICFFIFKIMQ